MMPEPDKPDGNSPRAPERSAADGIIPYSSTFQDLFSGGRPVWLKIIGAGGAAAVTAIVYGLRGERRGGVNISHNPLTLAAIALVAAIVGAAVGAALALKDVVHARREKGLAVSWPLRLMYCGGPFSAIFVWGPICFVTIIVVLFLVL